MTRRHCSTSLDKICKPLQPKPQSDEAEPLSQSERCRRITEAVRVRLGFAVRVQKKMDRGQTPLAVKGDW